MLRVYKDKKTDNYHVDLRGHGGGRPSLGTNRKRVAEQIAAQMYTQLVEGTLNVKLIGSRSIKANREPQITLSQAMDLVINKCKNDIKKNTLDRYNLSRQNLLKFFNGDVPITDLTPINIIDFKTWRVQQNVRPATVNRDLQFLRKVYNKLIKWDITKENPVNRVDMIPEDNIVTRVLSREETKNLIDQCHRQYLRIGVKMALFLGMRKNEILSLRLPDDDIFQYGDKAKKEKLNWIDLRRKMIVLNETKNRRTREVPINDDIFTELINYTKDRAPGPIYDVKNFREAFENARDRAEIKGCTFHDIRRTFISHMASAGISREIVQSICGQISQEVYKRYAHISNMAKIDVIQNVTKNMIAESKVIQLPAQNQNEKE